MPSSPPIGFLVKRLSERIECCANRDLASHHLTLSQSKLLMMLDRSPGLSASMKELENHFHSAQSTICGLVSRLELKGLVTTSTDPDDKRVKLVYITDNGREMCRACRSDIQAMEQTLVSRLTEEEQALLRRMLEEMCTAFEDHNPTKGSQPRYD